MNRRSVLVLKIGLRISAVIIAFNSSSISEFPLESHFDQIMLSPYLFNRQSYGISSNIRPNL